MTWQAALDLLHADAAELVAMMRERGYPKANASFWACCDIVRYATSLHVEPAHGLFRVFTGPHFYERAVEYIRSLPKIMTPEENALAIAPWFEVSAP